MEKYPLYRPQFYTSTILECPPGRAIRTGKALLKPAKYKDIIIQSPQHLAATKKITLYAFVIMDNQISRLLFLLYVEVGNNRADYRQ